jgi:hypothetical protein
MSKQTKLLIFIFCSIKLTLHLIADSHSGFQGDELLHIETGKHLAFGYMEFPPLIGVLAFIQNLFGSNGLYVHHLFAHLASILIFIFVAKTTIELGGKDKAVFLVLFGLLIGPSFERSQQLFQPVVFSQLFWVLSFYALVRFVKYADKKSLWMLTLFCILGFLTKYDAVFFIFGLGALLLFKRTRSALIRHKFWLNMMVFAICILPNIWWQAAHHYPALQMFDRLYEMQLDKLSRVSNFINLIISINPVVTLLLLLPGLVYFFKPKNTAMIYPLAAAIGLAFLLLLFKNGKAYYFYPVVLTIIPFGAVYMEQRIVQDKKWVIGLITILMMVGGILIPFGMPVYSFNRYLLKIYPYEKKHIEGGQYGVKYDEYYTKDKWKMTMQELKSVYDSLASDEQKTCLIWGKHYGQAGAVNLFRNQYHLPQSFSYHGSFYNWTPNGQMPKTTIALSYRVGNFFELYFDEVIKVRTIYNPYADNDEELYQYIYICKGPKQSFDQMKELFKTRVFE